MKPLLALTFISSLFILAGCSNTVGEVVKDSVSESADATTVNSDDFATQASNAHPDVNFEESEFAYTIKNYSNMDIQQALYTVDLFIKFTMEDAYIVSGGWAEDGYPVEYLNDTVFSVVSEETRGQIIDALQSVNNDSFSLEDREYFETLIVNVFNSNRLDKTLFGGNKLSFNNSNCATTVEDCFVSSPQYEPYTYYEEELTGNFIVQTKATFETIFNVEGSEETVAQKREYDIQFVLVKTETTDNTVGSPYTIISVDSFYEE